MNTNTDGVSAMSAELGLDIDELIGLAVDCNLGRPMKPLGHMTGEVFATDASYRTAELIDFSTRLIAAERERCAAKCLRPAGWLRADQQRLVDEIRAAILSGA